jgi:AcrR family transcriptional regulator
MARSDAIRNRALLLDAAARIFGARGLDASLEEVARCAGVGVGTLYRHFPNRDALIAAVLENGLARFEAEVIDASRLTDPWEALVAVLVASADRQAADRAFYDVVAQRMPIELRRSMRARVAELAEPIVRRAQEAGRLRADFTPGDFIALIRMAGSVSPPWAFDERDPRHLEILLDGLRPAAAP